VQSCPVTPAGIVGQVAQAVARSSPPSCPPRRAAAGSTAGFDGLIISRPHACRRRHPLSRLSALLVLIRRFHAQGKPIFGICLGAQLIARAFGKAVYRFGGCESATCRSRSPRGCRRSLAGRLAAEQRIMQCTRTASISRPAPCC